MNYKKLGFRCGLEIHQQLDGKKLFCRCPALNSANDPDISVRRRLRAVVGETGEIDKAAAYETARAREFLYVSHSEDTCLVEYDEQPPFPINEELLDVALQVALLMHCKIVDEVQVMRKTVVDGSNVSGFQRTALIAYDGWIETSKGNVGIQSICLEEEAAQKLEETKTTVSYKLDRLGIGLLEIATHTDIVDPEHAKEAAGVIGMILRSTEKVKRGLGTIRQDVNISMKAEPDFTTSFLRPLPGAARMYPETDVLPVRITKERIAKIKVPELISEKTMKLGEEFGIHEALAQEILRQKIDMKMWTAKYPKLEATQIAQILIEVPKELKSRLKIDPARLKDKEYHEVLGLLHEGKISKEAVIDILAAHAEGKSVNVDQYKPVQSSDIEDEIEKILKEKPGLTMGAYMGMLMAKYRGKIDGQKLMELLKKRVK
ncbi:hypothetical protein J4464_04365 [Candidatus Woesearchaeota archaeon]|nr:hypothetical protein [Candidatus Woesearchaeota archaeon]